MAQYRISHFKQPIFDVDISHKNMKAKDLELESLKHQFYDYAEDYYQNGWSPEIEENVAQMAELLSSKLKKCPKSTHAACQKLLSDVIELRNTINPARGE